LGLFAAKDSLQGDAPNNRCFLVQELGVFAHKSFDNKPRLWSIYAVCTQGKLGFW
jgi:hypothetical protein